LEEVWTILFQLRQSLALTSGPYFPVGLWPENIFVTGDDVEHWRIHFSEIDGLSGLPWDEIRAVLGLTAQATAKPLFASYIPPEMGKATESTGNRSARSQVYAVGMLISELLTFEAAQFFGKRVSSDLPDGLGNLIRKATALDPDQRYENIDSLMHNLTDIDRKTPVSDVVGTSKQRSIDFKKDTMRKWGLAELRATSSGTGRKSS
jgi:serine/threonine protein kinase